MNNYKHSTRLFIMTIVSATAFIALNQVIFLQVLAAISTCISLIGFFVYKFMEYYREY